MIVNCSGSIDNSHEVSEYTLSTGTKLVLTKAEVEEFVFMLEIIEEYDGDEDYDDVDTYNEPLDIKEPNE